MHQTPDLDSKSEFVLTFDIDWAPHWVIDRVAQILIDQNVKATWFVTHESSAIDRLRERSDLFELGIHPNCQPGSTHGESETEVLQHMRRLVPEAVSMRTHGLYQSTNFLVSAARDFEVKVDASVLLPGTRSIQRHAFQYDDIVLWRLPYQWEDDVEMFREDPVWTIEQVRNQFSGIVVFDFHPIHVVLNGTSLDTYQRLKRQRPISDWDEEFLAPQTSLGPGPYDLLIDLVNVMEGSGRWVREVALPADA